MKRSVLFVCLGNICRSTMAEIVFCIAIAKRGIEHDWIVDSAGTGTRANGHVGDSPDSRTVKVCRTNFGDDMIKITHHARQLIAEDFRKFDFMFGMDEYNLEEIHSMKPQDSSAVISLLGSFDPQGETIIEDPYYGGIDGFQHNFDQVQRSINAFLDSLYST